MGNSLMGRSTLEGMIDRFRAAAAASLEERLMGGLEGGRDAGGQADAEGRPYRERSAAILVLGGSEDPAAAALDLRVDLDADALSALRTLLETCRPVATYNRLRADDPPQTPAIADWERMHMAGSPPPRALRQEPD